jgi:hypothetical protein
LEDKPAATNHWVLVFLAIILIGTFLWRALATAHEFPSPELRNMTIGLDLLCLVGLIGLQIQISRKRPAVGLGLHVLFWIALLAGLGLFAIRLNGTKSWWTGHLNYELSPRSDVHVNPVVPADSPSAAYKAFFAAYNNKDIETMRTLISKDQFSDSYSTYDRKKADEPIDQRLRNLLEHKRRPYDNTQREKITGETATVEGISLRGGWYTVEFVKEDGKWKLKNF